MMWSGCLLFWPWVLSSISFCFAQSEYDLRLVGGNHVMEGRVEIFVSGEWCQVCDDNWDDTDAEVVCRQLGYDTSEARAYSNAHFGVDTVSSIVLDEVQCTGVEHTLIQCQSGVLGSHDCSTIESAGVSCGPGVKGGVRLVEGSMFWEGRVEVELNGVWGTVCDDYWDDLDATVVCRQLGLDSTNARALTLATYGQGLGPIHLDNVQCVGSEWNIWDCPAAAVGHSDCVHAEDAGVDCGQQTTTTVTTACTNCDWTRKTVNSLTIIYISLGVCVPIVIVIIAVITYKCCCKSGRSHANRVSVAPYSRPAMHVVPVQAAVPVRPAGVVTAQVAMQPQRVAYHTAATGVTMHM